MSGIRGQDVANIVTITEDVVTVQTGIEGPQGPSDADGVTFVPADPLTGTDVQTALTELAAIVNTRAPLVKSSIFIEDNTTPTVVTQNVAAKVAGTFSEGPPCVNCEYNGNRITYIGERNIRVMANASVDVNGPNNQLYVIEMRKNGLPALGARTKVRSGVSIGSGALTSIIEMVTGDFLELWITNTTSSENPTVVDATIAVMN